MATRLNDFNLVVVRPYRAHRHDTLLPSVYAATHSPSCVLFANARTTACTQARCARHGEGKMEKANAFQLQKNKDSNLKSLVNLKHMNRRLSPRPEKVTAKRSIEVDTKKRTRLPNQLHQQAQSIRPRRLSPRAEKVVPKEPIEVEYTEMNPFRPSRSATGPAPP